MCPRIVCIVEGQGEVEAFPILLRRLLEKIGRPDLIDEIERPQRKKRHKIVKPNELEREIEAASRVEDCEAIIVLLDADKDCAGQLGPELLARARNSRQDKIIEVVLAVREYEAWLIGGIASLSGQRGLPDLTPPKAPEKISGCKEWIEKRTGQTYQPTIDQAPITAKFNIENAVTYCPSFKRFEGVLRRIVAKLPPHP